MFEERGSWRGSRDERNRRAGGDDERSQHRKDQDKSTWRRESEGTQGALSRKRPAFREKKIPEESGNDTDRARRAEEVKDTNLSGRGQNERNWRSGNMHSERTGTGRDRVWNRDDERGAGSRQGYRADRDRFNGNGRSGFHGKGTRDEKKWNHDLFEEANKSPARANEEEQVAKVEALLAS